MSFRILLPILTYPDPSPLEALTRAIELAATLGGRVAVLVHEVEIPPVGGPVADLVLDLKAQGATAEKLSRESGRGLAQEVSRLAERLGVPVTLESRKMQWPSGEFFAATARTHDLTMLAGAPESPAHALFRQDILFGSGGPVVLIGPGEAPSQPGVAAVAWDGSRAAARALRDAMPILKRCRSVQLLTCRDDKPISQRSVDGALALLADHDVAAAHVPVPLDGRPVGEALQRAAVSAEAGLLVMGAYGHSRMREFILGGATVSALGQPLVTLFMSH